MDLNKSKNINFFMVIILIVLLVIYYCNNQNSNINENWVNYQELQFSNWETAQTPPNFYNRPEYRKPYRWPVCIDVDYPIKHCRHL